jgi:hypothetical protein
MFFYITALRKGPHRIVTTVVTQNCCWISSVLQAESNMWYDSETSISQWKWVFWRVLRLLTSMPPLKRRHLFEGVQDSGQRDEGLSDEGPRDDGPKGNGLRSFQGPGWTATSGKRSRASEH